MKKMIGLSLILILLSSCSQQVAIDWTDFIHFKGFRFDVMDAELSDPNFIGEEIGEVRFKLADHIKDQNYEATDGDASYLTPGTKLYAVINHPHMIAVKDPHSLNEYKLYCREDMKPETEFSSYTSQYTIRKIDIFKQVNSEQQLLQRTINEPKEITNILELLHIGEKNNSTELFENQDITTYYLILYSTAPIATKYPLYFNADSYYWLDGKILPADIEKFLLPAIPDDEANTARVG